MGRGCWQCIDAGAHAYVLGGLCLVFVSAVTREPCLTRSHAVRSRRRVCGDAPWSLLARHKPVRSSHNQGDIITAVEEYIGIPTLQEFLFKCAGASVKSVESVCIMLQLYCYMIVVREGFYQLRSITFTRCELRH